MSQINRALVRLYTRNVLSRKRSTVASISQCHDTSIYVVHMHFILDYFIIYLTLNGLEQTFKVIDSSGNKQLI